MKKILALLLTVLMLVLMVGCNSDAITSSSSDISRGKVTGNIYRNEVLGFDFHAPSSWTYYTDEQIAAAMNVAVDNFFGDNFKKLLENNPAVYDMMAVDSNTGTNIGVCYENLSKTFSTGITEKQYLDAVKSQLSGVSGMSVSFPDTLEKVKLGDTEFTRCIGTNTTYGVTMTQVYYLKKIDGYMASVIITIPMGYEVSDIEAMFR